MTTSLVVSLFSAAAAYGGTGLNYCPSGKMYAEEVAGCYCVEDKNKCVNTAVTCGSTRFKDTAKKNNNVINPLTACCTAKATCNTMTLCDAWQRKKLNANELLCAKGTCTAADKAQCCENDPLKCISQSSLACGSGKFKDT